MNRTMLVPAALFLLALSACDLPPGGVVVGSGELATEQRSLADFDTLESATFVDVELSIGAPGLTLSCDDNLLEQIETVIEGSALVIRTRPGVIIDAHLDCTAEVVASSLVALHAAGSGDVACDEELEGLADVATAGSGHVTLAAITVDDLVVATSGSGNVGSAAVDATTVDLTSSGSGDVALVGAASAIDLVNTGSGSLLTRELVTDDAQLTSTGSGAIEVHATASIDIQLSGSGDVHVWGDPADRSEVVTGSGDVVYH
jgi:hypothetical protein